MCRWLVGVGIVTDDANDAVSLPRPMSDVQHDVVHLANDSDSHCALRFHQSTAKTDDTRAEHRRRRCADNHSDAFPCCRSRCHGGLVDVMFWSWIVWMISLGCCCRL